MAPPKQAGVCDRDGGELYQRDDDKAEVVRARLETYEKQTAPLIDYYQGQGKLVRVNGQQDVDKVTADLLAAVSSMAAS
jgi:adenylate kinase